MVNKMFLKLTTNKNTVVYVNVNEIRTFKASEEFPNITLVDLKYGNLLVKERPEEIMEMLKEGN